MTQLIKATIQTNKGPIHINLYHDKAPITVSNFIHLAKSSFYNDITFHRVISDFMAQAGCPHGTGTGGPGYQFKDEFSEDLVHDKGVISMANAGPNTNGSQFFITHVPCPHLDGNHSVFGYVVDDASFDVLMSITQGDIIKHIDIDLNKVDFDYEQTYTRNIKAN